jgi:hypothetical protein
VALPELLQNVARLNLPEPVEHEPESPLPAPGPAARRPKRPARRGRPRLVLPE